MKNSTLIRWGATHAIGVLIYIFLLAVFFNGANDWFGKADKNIITPVAALMLFVFSALVTGGLVLGKPIMLYLDGQKKEGVKLLFFTGIGIFILMSLVFTVLLIMK
jgi:hypothetical protein